MKIHKIEISGFKSLAKFDINNVNQLVAFAGANGSGKSNIVDALAFVSAIYDIGAEKALRKFRGYDHVHSWKRYGKNASTFRFYIHANVNEEIVHVSKREDGFLKERVEVKNRDVRYELIVNEMDANPWLEEHLYVDNVARVVREKKEAPKVRTDDDGDFHSFPMMNRDKSILWFGLDTLLEPIFNNFRVFRFDPFGAKEPDESSADDVELNINGHNVATMLSVLEKDGDVKDEILNWLSLIVPGVESVQTNRQRLDGSTVIKFKEVGTKNMFPSGLVSDGTIYTLCIIVALYSRVKQPGITVIEEPERGIHPQAIALLIDLMRDLASDEHTIIITTHSESVIRSLKPEELWLANKISGHTKVINAGDVGLNLNDTRLDEAWLMNVFGAGLPW